MLQKENTNNSYFTCCDSTFGNINQKYTQICYINLQDRKKQSKKSLRLSNFNNKLLSTQQSSYMKNIHNRETLNTSFGGLNKLNYKSQENLHQHTNRFSIQFNSTKNTDPLKMSLFRQDKVQNFLYNQNRVQNVQNKTKQTIILNLQHNKNIKKNIPGNVIVKNSHNIITSNNENKELSLSNFRQSVLSYQLNDVNIQRVQQSIIQIDYFNPTIDREEQLNSILKQRFY